MSDKKLFVDEDWKDRAAKEKEQAEAARQAQEEQRQTEGEFPPASFGTLLQMLATQALDAMGAFGEEGEEVSVSPVLAKHFIDLLAIVEEKTRGNLAQEEAAFMEETLHQMRMAFVQFASALQHQMQGDAPASPAPAPKKPIIELP